MANGVPPSGLLPGRGACSALLGAMTSSCHSLCLQNPAFLSQREAGDIVREKGCFVVKSLWVGTSANWPHEAEDVDMSSRGKKTMIYKNFPPGLNLTESCFQMRPFIDFLLRDLTAPEACSVPYGPSDTNSVQQH